MGAKLLGYFLCFATIFLCSASDSFDDLNQKPEIPESHEVQNPQHYYRLLKYKNSLHSASKSNPKNFCESNPCKNDVACTNNEENTDYKCECGPKWTGKDCSIKNFCESNPCKNDVACTNNEENTDYKCECGPKWTGKDCSIKNFCESNPCKNEGVCTNNDANTDYKCECESKWIGKDCSIKSLCEGDPCQNGGKCSNNDENTDYKCECPSKWTGKNCTIKNFCEGDPCQNKGKCSNNDANTDYKCECTTKWIGKDCSIKNFCEGDPCQNEGKCSNNEADTDYKCECTPKWVGKDCNIKNFCEGDPCKNGGKCSNNDVNTDFKCECTSEWIGKDCNIKNLCKENPCQNSGVCSNNEDNTDFKCNCTKGWAGKDCSSKCDCGEGEESCSLNTDGSQDCKCKPKYSVTEDKKACNPITCKADTCEHEGNCTDNEGQSPFSCTCTENWIGMTCEKPHPCKDKPCQNGGRCDPTEDENDYKCTCPESHIGNECQKDNPCRDKDICKNGGTCLVTDDQNDYKCVCSPDYGGRNCSIECKCGDHGNCSVVNEEKKCTCKEKYILHDGTCKEDRCADNPCKNGGSCSMTENKESFTCNCTDPWTGSLCDITKFCDVVGKYLCPDTCISDSANQTGYCKCNEEEYLDYTTKKCEKTNFCPVTKCLQNQICENGRCRCRANFKEKKEGDKVVKCISDLCSTKPCAHESMNCTDTEDYFTCRCNDEQYFDGEKCRSTFCLPGVTKCEQVCVDDKECNCFEGYEMKKNKCVKKEETKTCDDYLSCEPGLCVKNGDKSKCVCPWGQENTNSCRSACDKTGNTTLPNVCPTKKCNMDGGKFSCVCSGEYKLDPENKITCIARERCEAGDEALTDCTKKLAECVPQGNKKETYICKCKDGYKMVKTERKVEGKEEKEVTEICTDICEIEENNENCYKQNKVCYAQKQDTNYVPACKCPSPQLLSENDESSCDFAKHLYTITLPIKKDSYMKKSYSAAYSYIKSRADAGIDDDKLEADIKAMMKYLLPTNMKYNVEIQGTKVTGDTVETSIVVASNDDAKEYVNSFKAPTTCRKENVNATVCVLGNTGLVLDASKFNSTAAKDVDRCDEKVSLCGPHTTCNKTGDGQFRCNCRDGYEEYDHKTYSNGQVLIKYCKEIDVCGKSNPCGDTKTSECINNEGSYYCKCKPGHKLKDESKGEDENKDPCIGLCEDKPCNQGTCTTIGDSSFFCKCDKGAVGRFCDKEDMYLKKAGSNVVVVGAVLGCILALTFIVFYVTVRKLKKRKHDYLEDNAAMGIRGDAEMVERPERQQFRQGQGATNRGYMRD